MDNFDTGQETPMGLHEGTTGFGTGFIGLHCDSSLYAALPLTFLQNT
jgi:hypothetical protein